MQNDQMSKYKIQFENVDWVVVNEKARYKIYKNDETQVRLIEYSAGLKHPDWCLKGHTAYVLEGKLEIKFESSTEVYEAGDILLIPDGENHKHIPVPLSPVVRFISVEKPT